MSLASSGMCDPLELSWFLVSTDAASFDLDRFVAAQNQDSVYASALAELTAGRKRTHWMWFVFPQLAGLGHSEMSRRYALANEDEARAYLAHPVLGARLRECAAVLVGLPSTDATHISASVDAMKLRSSMSVFSAAAPDEPLFREVLERYFP